jgi:hypothetical protein
MMIHLSRKLDQILNRVKSTDWIGADLGEFLLATDELRSLIHSVPNRDRATFLADIKELESIKMTLIQRERTLERMWKMYPFLKL